MTAIKLTAFTGEQPRILPQLMPDNAAQSAINCRLDDGGLTPMRRAVQIAPTNLPMAKTIYRHGDVWLAWDKVVHAAQGPVAQERLYVTGDGAPKLIVGEDVYPLAVPRPANPLIATLNGSGADDVTTRLYVYTWVTSLGEESEPCPVSNEVDWSPGQSVVLSGFAVPPSNRAITQQRIYRSQTAQSGTYFYLIAERDASAANFTDAIAVDALQEPLPSAHWNPPPAELEGLVPLPNGMMAGFVGRELHFCEPWRPHAWPERYILTTDTPIVGLGAMGTSILVMTEGQPYLVDGTAPEAMVMMKVEQSLPCINKRGIVDLGYAIAYPSHDGLVVARADGGFSLATANIFSPEGWQLLSPDTMIGSQLQGRYVAFYDATTEDERRLTGALLIDLAGQASLIRMDARATAAFHDLATGGLCYQAHGTPFIWRLDAPDAARTTMYWKSKEFVLPAPANFGAIRIDSKADLSPPDISDENQVLAAANAAMIAAGSVGGDINGDLVNTTTLAGDLLHPLLKTTSTLSVSVFADGKPVATKSRVDRIERLPGGFTARRWEIDVYGDVPIEQIVMASTVDELETVP